MAKPDTPHPEGNGQKKDASGGLSFDRGENLLPQNLVDILFAAEIPQEELEDNDEADDQRDSHDITDSEDEGCVY